jgi:hypothetical protein
MPLQNRVTPLGDLVAVPDRGTFTGNRGILHAPDKRIVRYNVGRRWIVCQLEFKGWRWEIMKPNRWTQLFFLDEATALSAGHRPSATCRHEDYQWFRRCWARAHDTPVPSADQLDRCLHGDRLSRPRTKRTFRERIESLADGVFVLYDEEPWLVWGTRVLHWTPGGYDRDRPRPMKEEVTVLTPRGTARAIAAGYAPAVHPSARRFCITT